VKLASDRSTVLLEIDMRIVMLGASGNAGRTIATLLAPFLTADDTLVLAGRDRAKLDATRAAIIGPAALETALIDVDDPTTTRAGFDGAGLVVMTVSRPDLAGQIARIALDAGADWFDTMLSSPVKLSALRALRPEIERAGRCFVTDGGFHPGLPGALVRWAAGELDELQSADVMGGLRTDWRAESLAESTVEEMLGEFNSFDLRAWVDGEWRRLKWSDCPTVDFGPPIGKQVCVPMPLAEMEDLPAMYPGLRNCGFYISGFGPVMDYLALPVIMLMAKLPGLRGPTRRFTRWSFGRLASVPPPHRLVAKLEATGRRRGEPATASVTVSGEEGYHLTAAPPVVCLRHLLDGSIRPPGLHLQAHLIRPDTMLAELAELGLDVETAIR
jgi:saccharopine dehydrogenase-like NADP-dependent oxidoreductase